MLCAVLAVMAVFCAGLISSPEKALASSNEQLVSGGKLVTASSLTSGNTLIEQASSAKAVYRTTGDTIKKGGTYVLTPAQTWKNGGVWFKNRVKVKDGMKIQFQYRVSAWDESYLGHADGIMLNLSKYVGRGGSGEDLGFVGQDAYGVELDNYRNWNDSDNPHVAIVKDDVHNHLVSKDASVVADGKWHTVSVTYKAKNKTLSVSIDGKRYLSKKYVKLPSNINVGLTASTGDGFAKHEVRKLTSNSVNPVSSEGKWKSVFNNSLKQVHKKYPKSMKWATVEGLYVPGVSSASVDGKICKNMIPQGICVVRDYLLITAYCGDEIGNNSSKKKVPEHDSVLYVMEKNSGDLLTTLALKGTRTLSGTGNHVGGIASDGYNIWIATSGYLPDGKNIGELHYTYDELDSAVSTSSTSLPTKDKFVVLSGAGKKTKASFNTYRNGYLWIGYFTKEENKGTLTAYEVNGSELIKRNQFTISDYANGATFFDYNDKLYLLVNKSTGRDKEARSIIYSIDDMSKSKNLTKKSVVKSNKVPLMMEEACYDEYEDMLYMITESAAKEYRIGFGTYPTNVIFAGKPDKLFI